MIELMHRLSKRDFALELSHVASHSRPIDSTVHLKGRQSQLDTLEQAIYAPGRHAFVFGERGVGKTSLAKTAARATVEHPSHFKQIGCASDSTFGEILRQVVEVFDPKRLASVQKQTGWSISKIVGFSGGRNESYAPTALAVSTAAEVLASLDEEFEAPIRVVVIDEIDRLPSTEIKLQFAELVKLLGDRGAKITFVFTGVGKDLEEVLGHHPSSFRQLAQIPLERLDYQAALDITDDALQHFGLSRDVEPTRTARFRVASIANGFPYYVHLLVEKLLYALYGDPDATEITLDHLKQAISAAVRDAEEVIRKPYDQATRGRNVHTKLAVWAAADSWDLERGAAACYGSYQSLCAKLDVAPLTSKQFSATLAKLRTPAYGSILRQGFRQRLYQFSENIVRGYVRLCAAEEGIELDDVRPGGHEPRITAQVREKRYIDPRRVGGPPSTLRR